MDRFANSSKATNISINEPGLHWNCSLNCEDRQCVIYCFGEKGFAISFKINDVWKARGRTRLEGELLSSVVSWLQGNSLNELHDNFEFIDPGKRTLEKFWEQATELYPELERCTNIILEPKSVESFCLWFITSERYCQMYISAQDRFPTCEFYWEDYYIFEFLVEDRLEAALILKRWFCDNVMPSDLAQEFSRLDKGKLSKYSDIGKVIEERFKQSWDVIEQFYLSEADGLLNIPYKIDILNFMTQMRQKGLDRTLRADQSHTRLLLSRSRPDGRRFGQSVVFVFHSDGLEFFPESGSNKKLSSPRIELTPQIEMLLKKLETQPLISII